MPKVTKVLPHLRPEEIRERIRQTTGFINVQKWLVIYNAAIDPRPAREIAKHTGLAEQTVHNLVSQYNRRGPAALNALGRHTPCMPIPAKAPCDSERKRHLIPRDCAT